VSLSPPGPGRTRHHPNPTSQRHRPPAVCRLLAAVAAVGVLGAAVAGCGRPDPLAGFASPRAVRLAPDGRLLVTDLGTGRGDGRVVAVDLATGHRQVLLDRLPSTRGSGQQHADLAVGTAVVLLGVWIAERNRADRRVPTSETSVSSEGGEARMRQSIR
jgi:hypothetical protein